MSSSSSYGSVAGVAFGFGCGVIVSWLLRRRRWSPVANKDSADENLESSIVGETGECKLVLVVNNELKMGKGKAAAQCSHAAVMAFDRLSRKNPELLRQWYEYGQPKVVLKTEDETSLLQLADQASSLGLVVSLVQDAGRTQIAPGSKTVVGIGPGPADVIDQVTGQLKLY